ncbi:hypothetical protein GCM10009742_49360 [Kribbella karoonensis]|uniref:Uncharacterized protein n=1 Tax=Kribbella karoonensis TaxID=324851 RepID=A0ABP4PZK2_9ACTN
MQIRPGGADPVHKDEWWICPAGCWAGGVTLRRGNLVEHAVVGEDVAGRGFCAVDCL